MSNPIKAINVYDRLPAEFKDETPSYSNYPKLGIKLGHIICVGPSSSGKTNNLISLLTHLNGFTRFWICAKHHDTEPLWKWFIAQLNKASSRCKIQIVRSTADVSALPPIESFDKNETHALVFDDQQMASKKDFDRIKDFFVRGRHHNITCFLNSQSLYRLPKIIRENAYGGLLLKKFSSNKDASAILRDYGLNMSKEELMQLYHDVIDEKFENFLFVEPSGRIRKNFGTES